MDMDFLTDPIFSELGRSDYIGGIDNEALDFGQLDQFMQVASSIGSIDEANSSSSNNHHNNHNNNSSDRHILACDPKTESPATPPNTANDSNLTAVIATVSARVGLSSTPIATPLPAGALAAIASHLPESPPDSGSEPPYSPLQDVHGLTLTSRDLYNGLPSLQQQQHHHLQQPQFTPPHQQPQPPQPLQHHYTHSLANQQLGSGIRVKHESGLIMNPTILAPPLPMQLPQQHQQQQMSSNTGSHESQQQLLHAPHTNAVPHYSGEALYTAVSYTDVTLLGSAEQTASCMLTTSISEAARVQVIGTTQASHSQLTRTSAPSTPVHLSSSMSRKRKLSTQMDCPDFARIKPDPGLVMNSAGSTPQHTPPSLALAIETQQLDPSSPGSISLPPHGHDMSSTPAHSVASLSPALSIIHSQADTSMDGGGGSNNNGGSSSGDSTDGNALTPCIRFSPFQPQNWHKLCDQSLQDIAVVYYRVDADKGFNFSVSDDAFVCQKKNHFQITCHARLQGDAKFVKTPSGLEKIKSFHLHFYGVKLEAPNQTIRVEQSQSDRSKKPFYPVPIDLQSHIVSKVTVGRLHFSETTNNNMRKKGRPNPEQRYFQLVVGLHVHTMSGNFPVISQGSERIIVRASNPGQFESDVDLCWQRGITQDSIFHAGRVGINTDRPDESLVVHGNLKISGHIVQPSDSRAKQEIAELDTSVQLRNLQKIRIVRYRYEPEFAIHSGLKRASASDSEDIIDTGVIAQEVREVIPDAVQEAGSIVLPNGNVIEKFLLVNKDRILMENIGAVKELCKVTGSLENRIEHLERVNSRLVQGKDSKRTALSCRMGKGGVLKEGYEMCSNRALQMIIFLLIIVMAACLTAVSTLYFVEHNRQHHNRNQLDRLQVLSNSHYFQNDATQMTEHERHLVQLHNILIANKTHGHWPNFLFPSSTPRPHARNSSKPRSELSYSENGDAYAAHGRNDELTVVMEKPVVSLPIKEPYKITTTAPLLRNKTIGSKNKSKWPLPQVVRALQVAHSGTNGATISEALSNSNAISTSQLQEQQEQPATNAELPLNVSESSSEKVADAIPLPQDFENNSIDIDAQHVSKKATPSVDKSSAALLAAASLNDAGHASLLASERDDEDVAPKLNEHVGADPIVSTSSSNSIISSIPDTTASARNLKLANGEPVLYSVYRTASPPASAVSNYSLEAPAISNKSQGVLESGDPHTADALDLQNLSGNNESVDIITALFGYEINGLERESSLGRRSTSQRSVEWVTRKTVQVSVLGAPAQCTREQSSNEQVSNCQSACFEDSNQLPPLRAALDSLTAAQTIEKTLSEQQQQNVESADVDTEDADTDDELESVHTANFPQDAAVGSSNTSNTPIASNSPGKTSHATSARAKQFSAEQQHAEEADNFEAELEHPLSEEHLDVDVPKLNSFDRVAAAPLTPNLSIEAHRPPVSDCWKIASALLADGLNNTFGVEDFCPNIGKSLNLTYIVPLSRFFKEQTIELHLSSSTPLLWTICNNHEHIKEDGKHLINTLVQQQHQQQEQDEQHEQQQQPQAQPEHYGVNRVNQLQQRDNTSILLLNVPSRGYFIRDLALRASNDFEKVNICEDVGAAEEHETNTLLQYNFRILRDCD